MGVHMKTIVLLALCFILVAHCSYTALSGEPEETRLSGEAAYEFFAGMLPPLKPGDWVKFRRDEGRIVETVLENAESGSEKRMVVETRTYDSEGNLSGVETRETVLPDSIRERVAKHEYFIMSFAAATIKDESISAVLVRGFQGGALTYEATLSSKMPLGIIALNKDGSTAKLVDYGWGDAAFVPGQDHLSIDEAFERIARALPEPNPGEWCEYFAPDMGENFTRRFLIVCGVDGRDGGRMLSRYILPDGESHFLPGGRLTKAEAREEYGYAPFGGVEYFTLTEEVVAVKGETKPVLTLNIFNKGFCGARLRFSPELPYPWLAGAVFIVEEGQWSGARLVDWGWKPTEDFAWREHRATVDDAVAGIVDSGLEQTAVGDWALYETLDGGTIRHEVVDVQTERGSLRYTNMIREFDAAGTLVTEARRTNSRDQIVDFALPSGDFKADGFVMSTTETTVMGESIPVLSITGFQGDTPAFRMHFSSRVPATQVANMVLYSVSPDPVWKLMEFGKK